MTGLFCYYVHYDAAYAFAFATVTIAARMVRPFRV